MKCVNTEENRCRFFTKEMEESYPKHLYTYKKASEFFPGREFEKMTGGEGVTNSFRYFLAEYIRNFRPDSLVCGKPYELILNRDGRFIVVNKDTGRETDALSESEKTIYRYLCFLHTARFWQEFEVMRNMHYEPEPLVIHNFSNRLDASMDMKELLDRARILNREIILIDESLLLEESTEEYLRQ